MSSTARVLIVGGHDPSGAGVDADLASLRRLEVEAQVAVTAWTDQDATGVRSIGAREPDAWRNEALKLARGDVAAVKFGLLPGSEHVLAARDLLRELRERSGSEIPAVVDPVISASSGGRFLDAEAVAVLLRELVHEAVVLTPNLAEAAELTGAGLGELTVLLEARREAADVLLAVGAGAVVVKGGHGVEDPVRDLIATRGGRMTWISRPRIAGGSIRGSGCRFASRLAANLALGRPLETAAEEAGGFVAGEIERAARR